MNFDVYSSFSQRVMFIYFFFSASSVGLPFTQSCCWFMGSVSHTTFSFFFRIFCFLLFFFLLLLFLRCLFHSIPCSNDLFLSRCVCMYGLVGRSKRNLCFCAILLCIDNPLFQAALLIFSTFNRLCFCLSKRKK